MLISRLINGPRRSNDILNAASAFFASTPRRSSLGGVRSLLAAPDHPVCAHVRRILEILHGDEQAQLHRITELERAGRRIVEGGQVDGDGWEIRDWRSGALLASGIGGYEACEAASDRLHPQHLWYHRDNISDEVPYTEVPLTPEITPSLSRTLEDWVGTTSTPDAEIADFVGWSVERVRKCRG